MSKIEDYIVHRDESEPGRIEFSRPTEEPPEHIAVTLQLVQQAHPDVLRASFDELLILNDRYRIVGWLPEMGALDCMLIPRRGNTERSLPSLR